MQCVNILFNAHFVPCLSEAVKAFSFSKVVCCEHTPVGKKAGIEDLSNTR